MNGKALRPMWWVVCHGLACRARALLPDGKSLATLNAINLGESSSLSDNRLLVQMKQQTPGVLCTQQI